MGNEKILRREMIVSLFWRKKTFTETRKWQSENTRPEEVRKKWHFHYYNFLHRERESDRAEIAEVQSGFNSAAGRSRWQRLAAAKPAESLIFSKRLEWQRPLVRWRSLTSCKSAATAARFCSGVSVATQRNYTTVCESVRLQRAFCVYFVMINNHCSAGVYKHTHTHT